MESGTPSLLLLLESLMMQCLRLCKSLRCIEALPQSVTCHVELVFYNRIIRTDSTPDILSPVVVAFELQHGLNYIIVLLTLTSIVPWFVNGVTDHSLGAESTAFL